MESAPSKSDFPVRAGVRGRGRPVRRVFEEPTARLETSARSLGGDRKSGLEGSRGRMRPSRVSRFRLDLIGPFNSRAGVALRPMPWLRYRISLCGLLPMTKQPELRAASRERALRFVGVIHCVLFVVALVPACASSSSPAVLVMDGNTGACRQSLEAECASLKPPGKVCSQLSDETTALATLCETAGPSVVRTQCGGMNISRTGASIPRMSITLRRTVEPSLR